jgi:elongation factor P--(R)-beta-lysine ligase
MRADWRPVAAPEALRGRAALLRRLREFMLERGFLEVETPLLSRAGSSELHVESLAVPHAFVDGATGWLATSPEFHLKRLLAAGIGDVYTVCKVFRAGEQGRLHNVEFTLVEWYRLGADLAALMDGIESLLAALLPTQWGTRPAERISYRDAFARYAGLDPFLASFEDLRRAADADLGGDRDALLDRIAAERVYPRLGRDRIGLIYHFPASQASLARVVPGDPPLAERVEAVVAGVELVNGFVELTDAVEQRVRFERDVAARRRSGRSEPGMDERLLAALDAGLPPCAGAALGFDRIAMLALDAEDLAAVQAFPADRA